jgi:serine/threonine protein phosphatase PrpC
MIPAGRAHLHVTAVTDPGLRGKSNEDRFAVSAHRLSKAHPIPSLLAIIADGVGGHRAGEVAAEMAVETISRLVAESDAAQPTQILFQALAHASQLIYAQSKRDLAQTGMGTTVVCAWIIGDRLYTAAAGDSRLYLLRSGVLQRLTTDHTWVQEALDHGALSPEGARDHPNAHVIRRYLGAKHPLRADLRLRLHPDESDAQAEANQGQRLLPGDRLLLCSDGLTDLVDDAEMLAALGTDGPIKGALNGLVALANERGGHDNITILALEMPAQPPVKKLLTPSRRLALILLSAAALLATLVLLAALGWYLLRTGGPLGATLTPTTSSSLTAPARETLPAALTTPKPTLASPTATPLPPASLTPVPTQPLATYTPWPTNTLGP